MNARASTKHMAKAARSKPSAAEHASIDAARMMSDDDIANIAGNQFEPAFTREQVDDIESRYEQDWRSSRRIVLTVLTMKRDEMVEAFGESSEGTEQLFGLVDNINAYTRHLITIVESAKSAAARLLCVAAVIAEGDEPRPTEGGQS